LTYFSLLLGSTQNFRSDVAALGRPVLRGISDIVSVKFFRLFTRLFLYAVFKEHVAHSFASSPRCRESVPPANLFALA